jgi:assimilatory nitrate reductase electron transfer subunit
VVVVGNGMAGARVAAELHGRSAGSKIAVLGAEPHRAYNRIMLSSMLAGKISEADLATIDMSTYGLDVRLGVTVIGVDPGGRTVLTTGGELIEYDHLILATGSRAVVPPLRGLDAAGPWPDNVATFRTLDDCRRILATAATARSAIILGGGVLGLEAARGLAARGIDVQLVHAVGHLMERQLDPGASSVLVATLHRLGITAHLHAAATAVFATAGAVTLSLADGGELTADLLVVACGVRPETELARTAGLRVERGVVVDEQMRTGDPDIFALGDCAQHAGVVTGLVAPAWEQARVVARVIAGERDARYRPPASITRLKAAGIDLAAMGDPSGAEGLPAAEELTFADPSRGTYARLVVVDDRLHSAIMLGDNPAVGAVVQLFDRGGPVPADRRALLLGRSIGARTAIAESPALMPDAVTVCQCNSVTKGDLVRRWRDGATGMEDIVAGTRASTGCGTCRDAVEGIAAWLSIVEPSGEAAA